MDSKLLYFYLLLAVSKLWQSSKWGSFDEEVEYDEDGHPINDAKSVSSGTSYDAEGDWVEDEPSCIPVEHQ